MEEQVFIGIIYAINAGVLLSLTLSYWLMWRIEHKRHIFALFLFILSVMVFVIIGNVHQWSNWIMGTTYKVPYAWARGAFLLMTSSYLLQSTWKKNLNK